MLHAQVKPSLSSIEKLFHPSALPDPLLSCMRRQPRCQAGLAHPRLQRAAGGAQPPRAGTSRRCGAAAAHERHDLAPQSRAPQPRQPARQPAQHCSHLSHDGEGQVRLYCFHQTGDDKLPLAQLVQSSTMHGATMQLCHGKLQHILLHRLPDGQETVHACGLQHSTELHVSC